MAIRKNEPVVLRAPELRIGNICLRRVSDGPDGAFVTTKIRVKDIEYCDLDEANFNLEFKAMPLTENVMKRLRRVARPDFQCIEFDCQPPGERQISNNFWSRDLHDGFSRLHLSPCYYNNKKHDELPADVRDDEAPEFWFCWICSHGTGSSWFMSVTGIHDPSRIRYVHELQNLFFWIERKELILR